MSKYEEETQPFHPRRANHPGDPMSLAFPPARPGVIVPPEFVTAALELADAVAHLDGMDAATLSTMPREMWTKWIESVKIVRRMR